MTNQPPPPSEVAIPQPQEKRYEESRVDHTGRFKYSLKVEQQPQRARMCGFGDKDRRPITPPPCIRLVITDAATGKPVDMTQTDGMFFVLQVDLWDKEGEREVNIVRSSSTSPAVSISTATMTSYPPPQEHKRHPNLMPPGPQHYLYDSMGNPVPPMPGMGYPYVPQMPPPQPSSSSNGGSMFTRNLIGSLTVNAAWLKDTDGEGAYFFVLQDLSVRTEGWFR